MAGKNGKGVIFFILILNAFWMTNALLPKGMALQWVFQRLSDSSALPFDLDQEDISSDLSENLHNLDAESGAQFTGIGIEIGQQYGHRYKTPIHAELTQNWEKLLRNGYNLGEITQIVKLREKTLEQCAPHILQELKGLAATIGFPYEKLLLLTLFNELDETTQGDDGCTSWVSAGTGNKYHEVMLHKNRDYDYTAQIVVQVKEVGKNGYTALVTASNPTGVAAGINEHGLAVVNNLISTADVVASGIGNLHMNRLILEECSTVEEVFDLIDQTDLNSGVIFLLGDKNKGAIIEVKASAHSTIEESLVVDNVMYRSNHFLFLNGSGSEATTSSTRRYDAAKEFLEDRKGNLTLLDDFELSRHHYLEDNQPVSKFNRADGSISNYHTLFGVSFQIPPNHTKELSSMWVAMDHPCSSVYIPVHIDASTLDPYLSASTAYNTARLVFENNLGPWAGPTDHFLDLEKRIVDEERSMQTSMVALLNANDYSTLDKTLTDFDSAKTTVLKQDMEMLASQKYWIDGFASLEGIHSLQRLEVQNRNISLILPTGSLPYATDGDITSNAIASDDWTNAILYADYDVPLNTSIEFKILDANSQELCTIPAAQIRDGYALSSLDQDEIHLYARLSTSNTSLTPILDEWRIVKLSGERDMGTYWENIPYYYWYGGAVLLVLSTCCCCCCRKKLRKRS